jgi:hypothetical protein
MKKNLENAALVEQEQEKEDNQLSRVPVCGGNLSSPVIDVANYIQEIHYSIGDRLYIENAD